ncbi:MAG: tnpA [Gemmataceae bacterium]|nr:tnpA [Gemmataceae bacterium]
MAVCLTRGESFGAKQFGAAVLGDKRRTARLVQLADAFLRRPEASLPRKCGSDAAYQGLLGLLACPATTHRAVIHPHGRNTSAAMTTRAGRTTLLIGDLTEFDFTSVTSLKPELGPIGNGRGAGFECFNLLAVAGEDGSVIGLANQTLFRRRRRKMTRTQVRKLPAAKRQSGLWARAAEPVPPTPAGATWVWVFDREGDTTEALRAFDAHHRQYLIRSKADRCVRAGHEPDAVEAKLHVWLRSRPVAGTRETSVGETTRRAGRRTTCGISYARVQVRWSTANGSPDGPPTRGWAVRVWELDPPPGEDPLEWLVLTTVSVESFAEACERVDWYERRWVVEEYHKCLKSGVQVEGPQVRRRDRLEPLLGMLSVVAVELLRLRDASRDEARAPRPAVEWVDPLLVEVLAGPAADGGSSPSGAARTPPSVSEPGTGGENPVGAGTVPTNPAPARTFETMTVGEFYRKLAKLGGYLGNFKKSPPGWQVLWAGWRELTTMAQGVRAVNHTKKCDQF